jgi:hypothetical protein
MKNLLSKARSRFLGPTALGMTVPWFLLSPASPRISCSAFSARIAENSAARRGCGASGGEEAWWGLRERVKMIKSVMFKLPESDSGAFRDIQGK